MCQHGSSSWLLASWTNANYMRFSQMVDDTWRSAFRHGYFSWKRMKHYPHHYRDIRKKKKAGFHVSLVE
jgi:hypothetical protein